MTTNFLKNSKPMKKIVLKTQAQAQSLTIFRCCCLDHAALLNDPASEDHLLRRRDGPGGHPMKLFSPTKRPNKLIVFFSW